MSESWRTGDETRLEHNLSAAVEEIKELQERVKTLLYICEDNDRDRATLRTQLQAANERIALLEAKIMLARGKLRSVMNTAYQTLAKLKKETT